MEYDQVVETIKMNSALESRTIYIYEPISTDLCMKVSYYIDKIVASDYEDGYTKEEEKPPIILKINSGGGSIYDSNHVIGRIDYLQDYENYEFHAIVEGIAASAALDIALTCCYREAWATSTIMYHTGSTIAGGTLQDIKVTHDEMERLWKKGCKLALKHTNVSEEWLDQVYNRNMDVFMDAEKAFELGFIDLIKGDL